MTERKFYVLTNLKNALDCKTEYFDDIKNALAQFQALENSVSCMPALGVEVGGGKGAMDLIHGVNGESVLVPDYRRTNNLSQEMKNVLNEVNNIVDMFVKDGVVTREYCSKLLIDSARVLIPVSQSKDGLEDGYCEDKILKTAYRHGCDAIDEVFIKGHGWVGYQELRTKTDDYCKNGVLSVDALNVVYVWEKKLVGVDGRMDVSPADFVKMVDQINKPYTLVAYDKQNYNYQYKDQHEFIVGSYENISDAVKAWYSIKEKHSELMLYVGYRENGRESAVFNGMNDDFQKISYDEAAKIYGFETEKTVDTLIQDATNISTKTGGQEKTVNRELDSLDMD